MQKVISELEKFNKERDWDQFHAPEHLIKSIVIESGELLECIQWNAEYNVEDVKEELADVMLYAVQLAMKLDLNIEEIMLNKIEKNAIKYPVNKAKGKSTKYDKL